MKGIMEMFNRIAEPLPPKRKMSVMRGELHMHNGYNLTVREHCENDGVDVNRVRGYMYRDGIGLTEAISRAKASSFKRKKEPWCKLI